MTRVTVADPHGQTLGVGPMQGQQLGLWTETSGISRRLGSPLPIALDAVHECLIGEPVTDSAFCTDQAFRSRNTPGPSKPAPIRNGNCFDPVTPRSGSKRWILSTMSNGYISPQARS